LIAPSKLAWKIATRQRTLRRQDQQRRRAPRSAPVTKNAPNPAPNSPRKDPCSGRPNGKTSASAVCRIAAVRKPAPRPITMNTSAGWRAMVRSSACCPPVLGPRPAWARGIETTRRIVATNPHIAVLVLTMQDGASVFAAVRAGARGCLLPVPTRPRVVRPLRRSKMARRSWLSVTCPDDRLLGSI